MRPLTEDDVRSFLLDRFSVKLLTHGINASNAGDDLDLIEVGVVDSLGLLEMIASMEQHFNITVDFESMDPAELAIVGKFSRFVAENADSNPQRS